jgi:hypothetical protein
MWYEKLNFQVDIERLRQEVRASVFTLGNQVIQGEEFETPQYHGFGGWSIQSRGADWRDGWESIQTEQGVTLENLLPTKELILKAYKHFGVAHSLEHDKPTQAYVGEIKRVMDQLKDLGLQPRRARVTCLQAGCKSLVHKDSDTTEYMARIHIPLWTNERCVHICDGVNLHMPADGSVYILWVNQWHQIRNDSDEDRFHIIMDAYDTKHVTQKFKYEGDFSQLENFARGGREQIDLVELTEDDRVFFEAIKARYVTNTNK